MVKETFERIGNILKDNPRIANYTITGYKYLGTRLVLHFRDCNQVYEFEEVDGDDEEYTMNELDEFNVGGRTYAGEFITALENKIKE
jgi:hypothetical protein